MTKLWEITAVNLLKIRRQDMAYYTIVQI